MGIIPNPAAEHSKDANGNPSSTTGSGGKKTDGGSGSSAIGVSSAGNVGAGGSMLTLNMDEGNEAGGGDGGAQGTSGTGPQLASGSGSGGSGGGAGGGGLLKLSMDENGLKEMRDNMAAAAKIVKQHHEGGSDGVQVWFDMFMRGNERGCTVCWTRAFFLCCGPLVS